MEELLNLSHILFLSLSLSSHFTFTYGFASTDIRVEEEVWAFPVISFVADLGGSLSLFIGVSLLSAWDLLEHLVIRYKHGRFTI